MKIVFLDAATVDLGDVDVSPLRRLGNYRSFDDTKPSQIARNGQGADVLITNKCVLGERELASLVRLKLICVSATGVNNIDLESARRRGIAVANVAGYSTTTVAEHAMLFLLALSHRLSEHQQAAMSRWSRSGRFALLDHPYSDLRGKVLGIVGYGHIGRQVRRLAECFGMKVLVAKRKMSSLRSVLSRSHFVTLHCPLTEATLHLINKRSLRWMKSGSFLLNLARGPIVEENDVARALRQGKLVGYATDVLSQEPPPSRHPLLDRRLKGKILMTPHIAWASRESRQRLVDETTRNIKAFQKGSRRNRVL